MPYTPFLAAILGVAALVFGLALLFALPTWILWNWLMPAIFKLPEISIFQAFGLLLLSGFLFKPSSTGGGRYFARAEVIR